MALKTTAQLKAFADANIDTNGVNSITGALMNTMLTDIIDSMVNKSTDSGELATNIYRSGSKLLTTSPTQITFSTALSSNSYRVVIEDPNGVGWENITDKQTTGFKITGLTAGTITFFAILNN